MLCSASPVHRTLVFPLGQHEVGAVRGLRVAAALCHAECRRFGRPLRAVLGLRVAIAERMGGAWTRTT